MLKNQKQRCRQPAIASLMSSEQGSTASRPHKRELIEELSKQRVKVLQTKSDNNHDRKTIAQKKLQSVTLLPKEQIASEYPYDEYQLGTNSPSHRQNLDQIQPKNRYNQCLREQSSSSNYGDIVSHYRQSKSRYKNAKDKAKKLIQNMIHTSKNHSHNHTIVNQLNLKMHQIVAQLPTDNSSNNDYFMTDRFAPKSSTASGSTHFKPKVEKCSTLRFGASKSPIRFKSGDPARPLSNSRDLKPSKLNSNTASQTHFITTPKQPSILSPKQQSKNSSPPSSHQLIPTQKSIQTVITNSETSSTANPLVLQGKHLFEEYGIPTYNKIPTQKQIIEETQNACRQVSRQLPITRKQTQKLITRARQKNKKIIGKLKEMKERRSAFRAVQSGKNDLTKSGSRFSKLFGNLANQNRSSLKSSILQSRLDQMRSSNGMESSGDNFLSLNSSLHTGSVIAFNEEIRQKILIHLETIKTLADYAQSFGKIYQDCNEWEDLIFLLYKKYYIERFKIYHILKSGFVKMRDGTVIKESPFVFDFCGLTDQELEVFRESKEEVSLELDLESTNSEVKSALRDLYNQFIEKTSQNPSINMYEEDNFAEEILEDLNEEINMLIESCGKSQKIKQRINEAIQVGLMIAHLEGYVLEEIEEIVVDDVEEREYFEKYYGRFLEIFELGK